MRNIRKRNALWLSLAILLFFSARASAGHSAQAIWVEPPSTFRREGGDFTVDVKISVTDPPGDGTGMYGFQYKLKWNNTLLNSVKIDIHGDDDPKGDLLSGWTAVYVVANETGSLDGEDYHSYAVVAVGGVAFTGVASLCTYTFHVMVNGSCGLDIYDEILADDTATEIDHDTTDGEFSTAAGPAEPSSPFSVENIALVIVIAIFFVAALYYVKKRIL